MPNWCYTSYVIDGKRKEVQSLFSKMNNLENRRKPLVDNSFGKTWLGCLVTKLGADWQKVYCRGSWSDLDWNGAILRFNTETAWGPMNEVFKLVKETYPSLEIYYMAEEDGMGVFITNDTDGNYSSVTLTTPSTRRIASMSAGNTLAEITLVVRVSRCFTAMGWPSVSSIIRIIFSCSSRTCF